MYQWYTKQLVQSVSYRIIAFWFSTAMPLLYGGFSDLSSLFKKNKLYHQHIKKTTIVKNKSKSRKLKDKAKEYRKVDR
jgi:hypothetical protein